MDENKFLNVLKNIEDKLGDNKNLVTDDLADLITENNNIIENTKALNTNLEIIKAENEKLRTVNNRLYQQIPLTTEEPNVNEDDEENISDFDFSIVFDEKGNFIKKF